MNDDMIPVRIPSTTIFRTSVLDFLPGQIAAALLTTGRYYYDPKNGALSVEALAEDTTTLCEAIAERLKQSPLWKPAVVIIPKENES